MQAPAAASAGPSQQARGDAGPSRPAPAAAARTQAPPGAPQPDLFNEMEDVSLGEEGNGTRPGQGPANPFHTDL